MGEVLEANEWDRLVVLIGNLTLAAGTLEMAVIAIACRIIGIGSGGSRRQMAFEPVVV